MNSLWKSLTGGFSTPSTPSIPTHIQTRCQQILTTPINLGPGLTQQDQMLRTHMVNFVQGDDHTTGAFRFSIAEMVIFLMKMIEQLNGLTGVTSKLSAKREIPASTAVTSSKADRLRALLAKSWQYHLDAWTKPEMVNELVDKFTQLARSASMEELRDVISGGTNGPGDMMLILSNDKFTALFHELGVFDNLTVNLIKYRLAIAEAQLAHLNVE